MCNYNHFSHASPCAFASEVLHTSLTPRSMRGPGVAGVRGVVGVLDLDGFDNRSLKTSSDSQASLG